MDRSEPVSEPSRPRRASPWVVGGLLGLLLLAGLLPAACSAAPAITGMAVNVTLRDFRIVSATPTSPDADVVFRVHNAAPATHEFVVVRTDLPADRLPIASDGLSVDEDSLRAIGEIGEVPARTTQTLALHLAPGRYVFFCNLEGHYLGGMHGVLQVTAGG